MDNKKQTITTTPAEVKTPAKYTPAKTIATGEVAYIITATTRNADGRTFRNISFSVNGKTLRISAYELVSARQEINRLIFALLRDYAKDEEKGENLGGAIDW